MRESRKVLLVSYYFPPLGMGGVQRPFKFAKYLPEFNWEPTVLTVKPIAFPARDHSLLSELPEQVKIIRCGSLDPLRLLYLADRRSRSKSPLEDHAQRSRHRRGTGGAQAGHRRDWHSKKTLGEPFLCQDKLRRRAGFLQSLSPWFNLPDNKVGFVPFAVLKARQLLQKNEIDLVFTTSPPPSVHLIGYYLKKHWQIPWVADFRDLWQPNFETPDASRLHRQFRERLQTTILTEADHILTVNIEIANRFLNGIDKKKITTIPNGFDEADYPAKSLNPTPLNNSVATTKKFTIIYWGTLSPLAPVEPFFQALQLACQKHQINQRTIRFVHIGSASGSGARSVAKNYRLDCIVEEPGYLPHRAGLQLLVDADLFLLLVAQAQHTDLITTGKIFEYLPFGKPVLAIAPEQGAAARLIEDLQCGDVVSPQNIELLSEKFAGLYWRYQAGKLKISVAQEKLKPYTRREQTRTLAGIFDNLVRLSAPHQPTGIVTLHPPQAGEGSPVLTASSPASGKIISSPRWRFRSKISLADYTKGGTTAGQKRDKDGN